MSDLNKMTLTECASAIKTKKVSSTEVTKACLEQIKKDKDLNNFITVCEKEALLKAAEVDKRIVAGETVGALAGVPVAIKDLISTKGIRTTCAAKFLENYVPPFDATVVSALKDADAVIIGKNNMDEFAAGSANENSYFGAVRNVHNTNCAPGGSSGGSANCVAALEAFASLGSDTGGSIRQPSSHCGVVGLKPTYSLVSRYGAVAFASSFDQIGPIARTVKDTAALLNVIAFKDKKDSTSSERTVKDYMDFNGSVKGLKIGIAREFFSEGLNGDVKAVVMKAVQTLSSLGAVSTDVHFKNFEACIATYYVLSSAEAASNFARFDGIKYGYKAEAKDIKDIYDLYYATRTTGFGDEVKRRIMMGNYVLSSGYYDAYYKKACKVRTLIKNEFDEMFKTCDIIIAPTAPETAPKLGRKTADHSLVYLADCYTVPVNLAGLPAISVPAGKDKNGMPIGVQLIGKAFGETDILNAAYALETALGGNK